MMGSLLRSFALSVNSTGLSRGSATDSEFSRKPKSPKFLPFHQRTPALPLARCVRWGGRWSRRTVAGFGALCVAALRGLMFGMWFPFHGLRPWLRSVAALRGLEFRLGFRWCRSLWSGMGGGWRFWFPLSGPPPRSLGREMVEAHRSRVWCALCRRAARAHVRYVVSVPRVTPVATECRRAARAGVPAWFSVVPVTVERDGGRVAILVPPPPHSLRSLGRENWLRW